MALQLVVAGVKLCFQGRNTSNALQSADAFYMDMLLGSCPYHGHGNEFMEFHLGGFAGWLIAGLSSMPWV